MPTTRNNYGNAERNEQNAEVEEARDYARAFAEEAAKASEQAMRVGTRHRAARGGGRSGKYRVCCSRLSTRNRAAHTSCETGGSGVDPAVFRKHRGRVTGQHCASQGASGSFAGVVRSRQGTVGEEHRSLRPARALPFAAGPYRRAERPCARQHSAGNRDESAGWTGLVADSPRGRGHPSDRGSTKRQPRSLPPSGVAMAQKAHTRASSLEHADQARPGAFKPIGIAAVAAAVSVGAKTERPRR